MEPFDAAWVTSMPLPARTWLLNVAAAATQSLEAQAAHWRAVQAILSECAAAPTMTDCATTPTVTDCAAAPTMTDCDAASDKQSEDGDQPSRAGNGIESETVTEPTNESLAVTSSETDHILMMDTTKDLQPELLQAGLESKHFPLAEEVQRQGHPSDDIPDNLNYLTLDRPMFRREKTRSVDPGRAHLHRFATTSSRARSCPEPSLMSLMEEITQRCATRKDSLHEVEGESSVKLEQDSGTGEISEGESADGKQQSLSDTNDMPDRDRAQLETEHVAMQEEGKRTESVNGSRMCSTAECSPIVECKPDREPIVECKPDREPIVECKPDREPIVECKPDRKPIVECKAERKPILERKPERKPRDVRGTSSSAPITGDCARCGCNSFENNHYSQGRCMNCFHKHETAA